MQPDLAGAGHAADDNELSIPLPAAPGEPALQMPLRRIPPGAFRMGARGKSPDEEPVHRVEVPYEFWLGTFVVTQAEYRAVVRGLDLEGQARPDGEPWNASPSRFSGKDRHPVENVSWRDAVLWCQAVTDWLRNDDRYRDVTVRLPTEIEWEYACRAGTETEYWCGDDAWDLEKVAWFGEDYEKGSTHPVDDRRSTGAAVENAFGLCGTHGNVSEWCHDEYFDAGYVGRAAGATVEPPWVSAEAFADGVQSGRARVVRGGSWDFSAWRCRSAFRNWIGSVDRFGYLGFRVCLVRGPAAGKQAVGGGAAAGTRRAEAEQAKPGKAGGTRPQPGGAGEAVAGRRERRGRGVVCHERVRDDLGDGKALLEAAAGRSPAARFSDAIDPASIAFAVIGKREGSQPCGHTSLDFSSFKALTHLFLWRLEDLEEITGLPESLVCLDVRGCQRLRSLPGAPLPRLETLDLGDCTGLPGLPAGLAASALRWLYLDGCVGFNADGRTPHAVNALLVAATSLEELSLVTCEWVTSLVLPNQAANDVVPSVGDPRFPERHLKKLVLRGCKALTTLDDLKNYPWLHHLDLRGCASLGSMPALPVGEADGRPTGIRTLYATGCDKMTEFCRFDIRRVHRGEAVPTAGTAASDAAVNVAERFRTLAMLAGKATEMRMAKVLFLGSGRCGKTTLAKALRWARYSEAERTARRDTAEDPCPEDRQRSTENIRLDTLAMEGTIGGKPPAVATDVHVWDFGGQEIYHNTHRLFASEGAVFVVVTTTPEEHAGRLQADIDAGRMLGLTEGPFRDQNTYRELSYWLDYVWEARGLRGGSLDIGPAPKVLVVFAGAKPADGSEPREYLARQAGRYRDLVASGDIRVEHATITRRAFQHGKNSVNVIASWIGNSAAEVADELGIRVPVLYKALGDECTDVARSASETAQARPITETKRDFESWKALVASHDAGSRSDRQRTEIARAAALYLHECGRLFFLDRPRGSTVILDQKWGVELVYHVTNPNSHERRAEIRDLTHEEFSEDRLWRILQGDESLSPHREFLVKLLDDCNLVLRLGNDRCLAIHPELLDELGRDAAQKLFKEWESARPGLNQRPLVNHSFVIHDTGEGLLLGRNAFQKVVAAVARRLTRDLTSQLFFREEERDAEFPESGPSCKLSHDLRMWRNGLYAVLRFALMTDNNGGTAWFKPGFGIDQEHELLILRMEWKPSTADGGFRGGIFVQMLCSDEDVKAERLREFLFGKGADGAGATLRAGDRTDRLPPLREYRLDGDAPDLVIDDRRPAGLPPEVARGLRGVGQPGWLRAEGPKSDVRYDVAISYRRKASEPFVAALHSALQQAGLHCYYDRERPPEARGHVSDNTLVRIYDTLRRARVLIVVPSVEYFATPTSDLTGADNIFCPVELADAVLAGTVDRPPRPASRFFWVRPEDEAPTAQTHVAVDQLQGRKGQIQRLLDDTNAQVIETRRDRGRSGAAFDRENTSIFNARGDLSRLDRWAEGVAHGTDQYLIAASGAGANKWDFSGIVARVEAALRRS
jgi:formylglycine-generating enzyme required for sulfatase activity